jgi:hypothetical protein
MALKEEIQWEVKIVTNNNIIEQINTSSYPGYSISYKNEKCVTIKIPKFFQITENIKRTLKPSQVQRHVRMKIYNSSALHILL